MVSGLASLGSGLTVEGLGVYSRLLENEATSPSRPLSRILSLNLKTTGLNDGNSGGSWA